MLFSSAESMEVPPAFQWKLETELMKALRSKSRPRQSWYGNITRALGWALLVLGGIVILSWISRSVLPDQIPAEGGTSNPVVPFELSVRQGNICAGPLAVAHNFSVSLTNEDKTVFVTLSAQNTGDEIRSFAWSPDGKKFAIIGNRAGSGKQTVIRICGHWCECKKLYRAW